MLAFIRMPLRLQPIPLRMRRRPFNALITASAAIPFSCEASTGANGAYGTAVLLRASKEKVSARTAFPSVTLSRCTLWHRQVWPAMTSISACCHLPKPSSRWPQASVDAWTHPGALNRTRRDRQSRACSGQWARRDVRNTFERILEAW